MRNRRNYYRILHVQPDAPAAIIRCSYRTLMQALKQHPDLGGDELNAAVINEAYAVLSDPERRAAYDRQLAPPRRRGEAAGGAGEEGSPPEPRAGCPFCHAAYGSETRIGADSLCVVCGSPLYPAARRRLEQSGRRGVARIGTEQRIRFFTTWPQTAAYAGEARDISMNGLRFATDHAVTSGQVLKVECGHCNAVVRVVHYLEQRAEDGLRWLVHAEFLTVRFRDARGAFVSAWV